MVFIFQVRDAREKFNPKDVPEFEEVPEDREPILTQFTSQWDLKLFREAQVMQSNQKFFNLFQYSLIKLSCHNQLKLFIKMISILGSCGRRL